MTLTAGTRLGPYEITDRLGAGGMGEVYRARDTRLERIVAVKVLSEDLAPDEGRRERFKREARAISSLSHPHICTLHDVGTQDGIDYLVMEYVEGEGLDQRLKRGPLPIHEAIRASRQIADALDNAHRQGVIHRDLKPGNIMLTRDGIKLLDFGLAKLMAEEEPVPALSELTQDGSGGLTGGGTILGTLEHMSPEQLEGKEVGVPADIFALGTLMFEMVTGTRPFRGDSSASVIAAVIGKELPPMSRLEPSSPREFDHIVARCLRKAPEERWQTAGDLMRELEWVESLSLGGEVSSLAEPGRRRTPLVGMVVFVVLVAAVAVGVVFAWTRPGVRPEIRLELSTPASVDGSMMAVSPDGSHVAFVASTETGSSLFLRPMGSTRPEALPDTDGAAFPFWSPDGHSLAFFADGELRRIDLDTRFIQTLAAATLGRGGTWSGDTILYVPNPNGPVFRISAVGGEAEPVILDDDGGNRFWPVFLPNGRHFLYFVTGSGVWVGDTEGRDTRHLLDNSYSSAVYSPTGHLLFVRQDSLMAQAFDPDSFELRDNAFPVADQVPAPAGRPSVSVSSEGTLAYRSGEAQGRLVRLDRAGDQIGQLSPTSGVQTLALSPDGQRVTIGGGDIWTVELATNRAERVTSDPAGDWMSVWSPDGSRLAFASARLGRYGIYTTASSGAGAEELIVDRGLPTDWSSDGGFILYRNSDLATGDDIWAIPMDPVGTPFPVVVTEATERDAVFAPAGDWIAYESNRTGRFEIYVQRFPDASRVQPVSVGGGAQPRWGPDGDELFYLALNGDLMTVPIEWPSPGGGDVAIGEPERLFRTRVVSVVQQFRQQYAVFPGSEEFLMSVLPEDRDMPPITIVLNWLAR